MNEEILLMYRLNEAGFSSSEIETIVKAYQNIKQKASLNVL